MKKISIIFIILLIFQIVIFPVISKATIIEDMFSQGAEFLGKGSESKIDLDEHELKDVSDDIYSLLFYIGVIVTVLIGAILGISFMMASVEGKAKIEEALIPYIIGCFVIFGAFGIWKIAVTIFSEL